MLTFYSLEKQTCVMSRRLIIGDVSLSMIITAVKKGTGSRSSQTGKPLLRASVEAGNPRAVMRWPSEGNRGTWLGQKRVFWGEVMVCASWKGGWTRVEWLWTALFFLSECWRLTMYFWGVNTGLCTHYPVIYHLAVTPVPAPAQRGLCLRIMWLN